MLSQSSRMRPVSRAISSRFSGTSSPAVVAASRKSSIVDWIQPSYIILFCARAAASLSGFSRKRRSSSSPRLRRNSPSRCGGKTVVDDDSCSGLDALQPPGLCRNSCHFSPLLFLFLYPILVLAEAGSPRVEGLRRENRGREILSPKPSQIIQSSDSLLARTLSGS